MFVTISLTDDSGNPEPDTLPPNNYNNAGLTLSLSRAKTRTPARQPRALMPTSSQEPWRTGEKCWNHSIRALNANTNITAPARLRREVKAVQASKAITAMADRCIKTAHPDGGLAAGDNVAHGIAASRTTRIPRLTHRKISGYVKKDLDCMLMRLYLTPPNK
jgi:hypothetical protein